MGGPETDAAHQVTYHHRWQISCKLHYGALLSINPLFLIDAGSSLNHLELWKEHLGFWIGLLLGNVSGSITVTIDLVQYCSAPVAMTTQAKSKTDRHHAMSRRSHYTAMFYSLSFSTASATSQLTPERNSIS